MESRKGSGISHTPLLRSWGAFLIASIWLTNPINDPRSPSILYKKKKIPVRPEEIPLKNRLAPTSISTLVSVISHINNAIQAIKSAPISTTRILLLMEETRGTTPPAHSYIRRVIGSSVAASSRNLEISLRQVLAIPIVKMVTKSVNNADEHSP